jgi:two-component system chemotaxis response regulator CheY
MESIQKILVVDDSEVMQDYLKISLQKCVYKFEEIYTANNGQEAIEVLSKTPIDFILTDINMPILDGIELLTYMNNHPIFKDIPAVAVTTDPSEKLHNMLTLWGHGILPKPFKLDMLEQQISTYYTRDYAYTLHG